MHRRIVVLLGLALLTFGALSGCTADKAATAPAPSTTGMPATTGLVPAVAMNATVASRGLHDVAVNVAWTSPGSGTDDTPDCDPGHPGVCGVTASETIYMSEPTPFNGTFLDVGRFAAYPDAVVPPHVLKGVWVFTGSIVGCTGAGTATFPYVGEFDIDEPASADGVHGHEVFSAPTNFTGFARITDAHLDGDYYITPGTFTVDQATLIGTVTCE